ncbi:MAG: pyridoxal phosphate-dependent aminotransferase [Myxococcales bacterium]
MSAGGGFYRMVEAIEAGGKPILRLHIGETRLPPPPEAVEAASAALRSGKPGYGSAWGALALREAIARREGCAVEQVVVGPGSKHLLYALLSVLADRGAKVAVPSPAWPAYELMARQLGLELQSLPSTLEDAWRFDPATVESAALVLLCNPLNPTSTVYPPSLVEAVETRTRAAGATLILDEAYRGLAFEEVPTCAAAIRVRSFSKEFSLEGWRLGYAVAPAPVAEKLAAFNQLSITCVPQLVQAAGLACLQAEERILCEARAIWRMRAGVATTALREAGFQFVEPQSGMYVFAAHPEAPDDQAFAERLLKAGVAVAAGSAFRAPGFVRICTNCESHEFQEAVRRMRGVLKAH